MSPFGLETLPAEALKALRTLPLLGELLTEVASHTSVLNDVNANVRTISGNVEPLPRIDAAVAEISGDTGRLPEVAAGLTALADRIGGMEQKMATIDGRMATIEDAMPVLVAVQQHLSELPETMQSLDAGITGMTGLLRDLVKSIEALDANVAALQESMKPVGRLADKLPGGSKRSS